VHLMKDEAPHPAFFGPIPGVCQPNVNAAVFPWLEYGGDDAGGKIVCVSFGKPFPLFLRRSLSASAFASKDVCYPTTPLTEPF
jgi:hypothetical protein